MGDERPTLTDHLKVIIEAKPHESYKKIAAEVNGMSELAKYVLSLAPERLIPVQDMQQVRQQQQQREQLQQQRGYGRTAGDSEMSFPARIGLAYDNTKLLADSMIQLKSLPQTGQDSQNVQSNFRQCAGSFVKGWNYLIPTMQAIIGTNPLTRVAETLDQLKIREGEADRIIDAMRDASAKVGLSPGGKHFQKAADEHQTTANRWMWATIILTILFLATAVVSLFAYRWECIAPKGGNDIQFVSSKIVFFAGLSFMVLICGRNYRANRHNAVVNRHRQNALLTYQALVEAAKETGNRDAVLQQAAACIFGSQPTGFTKEGSGESPSVKSFVELITPIARQQG